MQLQENTLFHSRYRLIKLLGRGGFSEVWLAEDNRTGIKVALKVYAPGAGLDDDGVQLFGREFSLVFNFNHSNLLRPSYFDVCERMPYLIMPFCERGSAAKSVGNISEEEAWKFLHDVAAGLAYLHEQEPDPVIHQDIKPDNVLIDHKGKYLITDFGISTKARSTLRRSVGQAHISGGTTAYMPPERFGKDNAPIKAGDVWALGATMFELLTGDVPFGNLGGGFQKSGAEIPNIHGDWSSELKEIVEQCLQQNTWDRPTAEQIVKWTEQHFREEKIQIQDNDIPGFSSEPHTPNPSSRIAKEKVEDIDLFGIEMIYVQGGTFTMGCTAEQGNDCDEDEKPAHQVRLNSFYMGKYTVTQAQWKAVMGINPSSFKGDNLPVESVSWHKVQEFIRKLNEQTGKNYRLPTEAEWEYAARGGNKSKGYKYSGSNTVDNVAWHDGNSGKKRRQWVITGYSGGATHPVGQKSPNELGIYDMSGNVWEWCDDWSGNYSNVVQTNPKGPSSGSYRVIRGGSWYNSAQSVRVPYRSYRTPDDRGDLIGFRLARSSK